jgi:putative acetyltransferase
VTRPRQNLTLRPATNSDRAGIEQLVFSILEEYGLRRDPDGTDADLRDIEGNYRAAGGCFDVLVDESGRVAGSVALMPRPDGECEMRKMYLAKEFRGEGHGRALLEHAIERARQLGFRRIVLETAFVLREAIQLYVQRGFRPFKAGHMAARCDCAYALDL